MKEPKSDHLTHLDLLGRAAMVDIGAKPAMRRRAVAEGFFRALPTTIDAIVASGGHSGTPPPSPAATALHKGDALAVARIAAIQAAKRCADLIPLCHSLPLDSVAIDFERREPGALRIIATAATTAKTGVEMEAILAATIAGVTLYDMAKSIDRNLTIDAVRLIEKTKSPA